LSDILAAAAAATVWCCSFDDVKASYDIFNCLNLSFWEYMLPGEQHSGMCTAAAAAAAAR
jgi:hypothetical protein